MTSCPQVVYIYLYNYARVFLGLNDRNIYIYKLLYSKSIDVFWELMPENDLF